MKTRNYLYCVITSLIVLLLVAGFSKSSLLISHSLTSLSYSQHERISLSDDDPENEDICGLYEADCEDISNKETNNIEINLTQAQKAQVTVIYFWMQDCAHCEKMLNSLLPEMYLTYGDQVYFYPIELKEISEIDIFYQMAERLGVPKNNIGVPLMIISDKVLYGNQIENNLKKSIDSSLQKNPYTFVAIPEFEENLPEFLRNKQVDHTINMSNQSNNTLPIRSPFPLAFVIGMPFVLIFGIIFYIFTKKNNLRS